MLMQVHMHSVWRLLSEPDTMNTFDLCLRQVDRIEVGSCCKGSACPGQLHRCKLVWVWAGSRLLIRSKTVWQQEEQTVLVDNQNW